jgi:hypothetical protein
MKKNSISILLIILSVNLFAQETTSTISFNPESKPVHSEDVSKLSPLQILEDSLVFFADSMYFSETSENKISGSYAFINTLKSVMKTQGSFTYPFTKLMQQIVILEAPDKSFKIYNWEIIRGTVERRYYGVMQMANGDFIPLIDASDQIIRGGSDSIFVGNRWFGCLYYNIIQKEIAGQNVYFLLGWNASNMNSERKIIEPFGFNSKGQNVFGAPLISYNEKGKYIHANRYILEYQKNAKVSMNYDKETDQIIFDHCESQIGDPAKKYTYIPDGTYDGLRWDGQTWKVFENIIQITELQNGSAPMEKPIK